MSTTVSATTDRISLIGLSARGHHGVLPFEREEGQLFTVDVILDLGQRGTAVAAVTDSVTDAVDYSRVANGIVSIIEGEPVNLIESLADRIAERVLSFPRVVAAEVTVHNLAIVSAIGSDLKVKGILAKTVAALAEAGISIQAIHQSIRQVEMQCVVNEEDYDAARRILVEAGHLPRP